MSHTPDHPADSLSAHPSGTGENRMNVLDLTAFFLVFGTVMFVLPLLLFRIAGQWDPSFSPTGLSVTTLLLLQGVMNFVLLAYIVAATRLRGRDIRQTLGWQGSDLYPRRTLIGFGAGLAVAAALINSAFPPAEPPPIERLLQNADALWLFVLFGIAVAPFLEEVIFRGFLYRVLEEMGGARIAVVLSAVFFAGLHVPQLIGSWAGIVVLFLVALLLSTLRMRTNSLIPPFVVHTAYNTMLFGVAGIGSLLGKP